MSKFHVLCSKPVKLMHSNTPWTSQATW